MFVSPPSFDNYSCDHARRARQVLSSNRWVVVSGLSREVSRLDAGVVRRRAAVVSAPTAAMEWLWWHWCHGCRSGGVLWLQVGGQRRSCTHASPQRCAPAKVGYERCRRTPKETPDRVSLHFRSASRQLASGCKDTRRGTIPRRVDVAGPGIGRVSSEPSSSSSSADPRPQRTSLRDLRDESRLGAARPGKRKSRWSTN